MCAGFVVCFFLIDKWGRKPIQILGFCGVSVSLAIMGFALDSFVQNAPAGKHFSSTSKKMLATE